MPSLTQRVNDSATLSEVPLHTSLTHQADAGDGVACCPTVGPGLQIAAALVGAFVAGYNL